MKTLTIDEAKNLGFRTVRCGLNHYLPVRLPSAVSDQDGMQELIADQFDPHFEPGATKSPYRDREEGYFVQVVEDTRGRFGVAGTLYIVRAHYSENDGVQDWDVYGAVKVL